MHIVCVIAHGTTSIGSHETGAFLMPLNTTILMIRHAEKPGTGTGGPHMSGVSRMQDSVSCTSRMPARQMWSNRESGIELPMEFLVAV